MLDRALLSMECAYRWNTHLVALARASRAGGCAECRLRPSAFCMSMLMHGVSLHTARDWLQAAPLLVRQSDASCRSANGARPARMMSSILGFESQRSSGAIPMHESCIFCTLRSTAKAWLAAKPGKRW